MMDEYIKRNNAISAVCFGCNQQFSDEPCEPCECSIRQSIMALPTADVVPKSEVEELIRENESLAKTVNEAIELIRKLRSKVKKSKTEVAMEIFVEIEKWLGLDGDIRIITAEKFAELKKKYTE